MHVPTDGGKSLWLLVCLWYNLLDEIWQWSWLIWHLWFRCSSLLDFKVCLRSVNSPNRLTAFEILFILLTASNLSLGEVLSNNRIFLTCLYINCSHLWWLHSVISLLTQRREILPSGSLVRSKGHLGGNNIDVIGWRNRNWKEKKGVWKYLKTCLLTSQEHKQGTAQAVQKSWPFM